MDEYGSWFYVGMALWIPGICTKPSETRPETHVSETETRPRRSEFCPRRDRDETLQLPRRWPDLETPETLESLGSFNVSPRRFLWRMVKHIDTEKIIRINYQAPL